MKVLITGLHRSGTSATAKLLAYCTSLSLLDDPEWAIFDSRMGVAYQQVPSYRAELQAFDIVKCPRLAEWMAEVLFDFPAVSVIFLLRDPRDVYCSIVEAQLSSHPSVSTMLENSRFGKYDKPWEGVSLSFKFYAERALQALKSARHRVRILMYEDLARSPAHVIAGIISALALSAVKEFPQDMAAMQLAPLRNKHPSDISIKGSSRWQRDLDAEVGSSIWTECSASYQALAEFATPLYV